MHVLFIPYILVNCPLSEALIVNRLKLKLEIKYICCLNIKNLQSKTIYVNFATLSYTFDVTVKHLLLLPYAEPISDLLDLFSLRHEIFRKAQVYVLNGKDARKV